jgi:hypothetical protein
LQCICRIGNSSVKDHVTTRIGTCCNPSCSAISLPYISTASILAILSLSFPHIYLFWASPSRVLSMRRKVGCSRRTRRNPPWTEDDTIELLAQLDFIVDSVQQEKITDCEAVVLRKLAGPLNSRSQNQIRQKLAAILRDYSSQALNLEIGQIYRLGTCCLDNLPNGIRMRIRAAVTVICTNTPRKTRSALRAPERTPISRGRLKSVVREGSPTENRKRCRASQRVTPSSQHLKLEPSSSRASKINRPSYQSNGC